MSTDPEPMEFDAALRELAGRNLVLKGHGTDLEERARGILEQGLLVKHTSLLTTTIGLNSYNEATASMETDIEGIRDRCLSWPHNLCPYIAIIGVEVPAEDPIAPDNWVNAGEPAAWWNHAILQEVPANDPVSQAVLGPAAGVVPRRFIAGYVHVADGQLTFIPNPAFDPTWDPQLLATSAEERHLRMRTDRVVGPPRELVVPPLAASGKPAAQEAWVAEAAISAQPTAKELDDIPFVW